MDHILAVAKMMLFQPVDSWSKAQEPLDSPAAKNQWARSSGVWRGLDGSGVRVVRRPAWKRDRQERVLKKHWIFDRECRWAVKLDSVSTGPQIQRRLYERIVFKAQMQETGCARRLGAGLGSLLEEAGGIAF